MQRICSRALALLICSVMFVGLIGARPLRPPAELDPPLASPPAIGLLLPIGVPEFAVTAQAAPPESIASISD